MRRLSSRENEPGQPGAHAKFIWFSASSIWREDSEEFRKAAS